MIEFFVGAAAYALVEGLRKTVFENRPPPGWMPYRGGYVRLPERAIGEPWVAKYEPQEPTKLPSELMEEIERIRKSESVIFKACGSVVDK